MNNKFIVKTKKYTGETSIISIRIPNELVKKYEGIAAKTGRTRNEILSMALEYASNNLEIK